MGLSCIGLSMVACSRGPEETSAPTPAPVPEPEPVDPHEVTDVLLWTDDEACPEQAQGDCRAALHVGRDGRLLLDPWGNPETRNVRRQVTPAEVEQVYAAIQEPEFIDALDHPCEGASDAERFHVETRSRWLWGDTGNCNGPAVQAARTAILNLVSEQFEGHHLISPPF